MLNVITGLELQNPEVWQLYFNTLATPGRLVILCSLFWQDKD